MKNLDKEEFRVKLEEINHLVEQKDYKGAMNVVDSIDWRRVKNVRTLCVVGEIYAANKRYEDSKEIFLLAYHRASIGKNILYRLVEVSLKLGQAVSYTHLDVYKRQLVGNSSCKILQSLFTTSAVIFCIELYSDIVCFALIYNLSLIHISQPAQYQPSVCNL